MMGPGITDWYAGICAPQLGSGEGGEDTRVGERCTEGIRLAKREE